MDTRPTDRRSRRLLLVFVVGLALASLALAIPLSMAANASVQHPTLRLGSGQASNVQSPISNLQSPAPNLQPQPPLSPLAPLAGPTNGGFENALSGWTVGGSAAHVEALQQTNFTPNIAPTEGVSMALLCSGSGGVSATAQGNLDGDLNGTPAYDTSILSQIFVLTERDVPATLIFDWSFLTSEGARAPDPYDDFFRVKLGNDVILAGSKPGGSSPFTDVALTEPGAQVTSAGSNGSTLNCDFTQGRSAFGTFRHLITDPGTYTLEFLVADEGDNNIDSGLLIDDVRLIPEIDLIITKTATPDPAIAGEPLVYEITVTNDGTGRARDVIVTDTLPLQVEFITDTLPNYVTETLPSGCTFSAGSGPGGEDQLFCGLGDILGGESVSFEVEVDVDSNALANGTLALVNTAEVDAVTPDRNPRNDTIILETILQDRADLQVLKMSKPDTSVRAGDTFSYTIFVDNLGPSHARNVVLTDTILSSGAFTLLSANDDPNRTADSCTTVSTPGGTVIACELGESLEPQGDPPRNGRWVIQVMVEANQAQDVDNVVTVFSADPDGPAGPQTATPDPDTSNNQATDFIAVTAVADLKMTKLGEDDANPGVGDFSVRAGERVRWTITVVNYGPSTSENVAVVDVLPRGLVEGSVVVTAQTPTPGGGQCTVGTPGDPNEPLICQLGNLAPTDTATVTIRADVDPSYVADQPNTTFANYLPNDAYLTSDTFDPEAQNNIVYDTLVEVTAEADLAVQKSDRPDYVIAGEQLEYNLTISNAGPSTAEDVVLHDQLPDALTAIEVNVINEPEATCTIRTTPANVIDCGFGDIVPGEVISIVVTSRVRPSTPAGTITNTATVSSLTSDPGETPNQVQEETRVETEANLKIDKTSDPDKVYAGEQKKYTVVVENLGPSDALTVTVTDTLPVSLTYEIDTNHCDVVGSTPGGAQVLKCRYGRQLESGFVFEPLPPGGTWQFDVWARVHPALLPGTTITNTAVVTGNTTLGDPNMDNNTATVKNLVLGKADLKITKFGKPDGQVRAGENLTYTVIVDNLGPGYAHDVVLTDVIQSDNVFTLTQVISDRPATCTPQPPPPVQVTERLQLRCELEDPLEVMTPDASGRWILTVVVYGDETQDINNAAHVLSSDLDPDQSNNQAFVEHDITDVADLEVSKTAQGWVTTAGCPPGVELRPDQVTAGLSLTYTLTITNHGPSTAENVVLEDRLPPFIVVTHADPSQGSCQTGTPGEPLDKLTCGLGHLAPNASATITVTADVPSWVPDGTILENDAFVYSDIFDDTNANNFATNLTTVSAWADLAIEKSDNPTTVVAGELLNYTIVVTNAGPSDALNVVVTDTLPNAGVLDDPLVKYLSDTDACYQDPINKAELTCSLGNIPAGGRVSFDILVQVNPDAVARGFTTLTNSVTVSSDIPDPCLDNNSDTEETGVGEEADIYITKADLPDPAVAGTQMRYLVTFGNRGPSVARSVTVTDTLPAKFVFNRCEPIDPDDEARCSVVSGIYPNAQTIRLDFLETRGVQQIPGNLDVDEEHSFFVVVDVSSSYVLDKGAFDPLNPTPPNPAENTAYVASATPDTRHPQDNQDTERTGVLARADLEVRKTDTPDPSLPDAYLTYDPVSNSFIFTYTITVRNNGPSDAAVVLFEDTLPPDAEFITWTIPAAMQCVFRDDGTVICLVGNDPDNTGVNERGRLNAGSEIGFTIRARADAGPSPRPLINRARVRTVSDDDARIYFTIPDVYLDDTTPTPDPNPRNNVYVETTTVLNARVRVDKRAFLGDTTGLTPAQVQAKCESEAVDDLLILPDTQVTYCYFIYNEGDTWLNQVELTDAPSGHVETAAGPFVNVVGRAGSASEFNETHALWASLEGEVAPLAPAGQVHPDGYFYLLATRTVTVDFPAGTFNLDDTPIILGSNTATVTAVPTTKYSTTLPGVALASDDDLLHDTLAVPDLEGTTKDWDIYEDLDLDGLPSPGDTIQYVVDIVNTGAIEATGVRFYDGLFNYIANDPNDPRVPALLVNGSVEAAIHVSGQDPVSGREIDADLQPPDLAFGEDLLLRTQGPGVDLTYLSAVVLDGEILKGNTPGDDEVHVYTRLPIPPQGLLLRFDGVTYEPPIPVTFSLRVRYKVRIKETVQLHAIVLNHGWVYYDEIGLFDQRFPQFDPAAPDANTADNQAANNHAGTPGRDYENPDMPGWPEIPAGVEPTNYEGPRFDDYALPGLARRAALRNDDDPTWFKVEREAPSIGADTRMQVPILKRVGATASDEVEVTIQVQNLGVEVTAAALWVWDDHSDRCPPRDPGPQDLLCTAQIKPGSAWTWKSTALPGWARSGVVVSFDPNQYTCDDIFEQFFDTGYDPNLYLGGQPVGVTVKRAGPGLPDDLTRVTSTYEGFSRAMEGVEDLVSGGYNYYAPTLYGDKDGLTSWLYLQNSDSDWCTSVEVWVWERDGCLRPSVCEVTQLAPGETYAMDVAAECTAGGFEGSAYIRASKPLGVVVDHVGENLLMTYRGVPAELNSGLFGSVSYFTAGSLVNYGPLIYREFQGWDTKVHVQNLSSIYSAKVKAYFMDNSGDIITTLVDWVCPRGSQEFFLPVVNGLPGHYVGAVRVESQDWWSPGDPPVPSPRIMSVAELVKYEGPARAEPMEAIAYNLFGEDEAFDWQVGEIESWGVRRIGLPLVDRESQKGSTTEIAIQNVVPTPGFTDFAIYFYDQNGLIDYACQKLNQKQVEYINIAQWGFMPARFHGSAVISATEWNHQVGGRNVVGLAAVLVERSGTTLSSDIPGDESAGVQGFPVHRPFKFLRDVPSCPGQP